MSRLMLLLNGPNLNLLGAREPSLYGTGTLAGVVDLTSAAARELGYGLRAVQSNHEGELVEAVHAAGQDCQAAVVNAGAYTHTSVALRDALTGVALPFAEVHLTNVHAREPFRHRSLLADVALCVIAGAGVLGYELAVRALDDALTHI